MNEIPTLFTAIGDFFTKSDWSAMVKWPFWVLLFTVAAGGVYCARYGKKSLLNLGICDALSVITIYLTAALAYIYLPSMREYSELPFLAVSDDAVTLVDPFTMELGKLAPLLLRLMILVFLVSTADSFTSGGKGAFSWCFAQCGSVVVALFFYTIITAGITLIFPALLNRLAIIPVVLIVGIGVLMLCAKFIFTKVITKENSYYKAVNKFFTSNRGGILFPVSALSFLLISLLMSVLHLAGLNKLVFSTINSTGLWIILLLLLAVLYIFATFYTDRKKS